MCSWLMKRNILTLLFAMFAMVQTSAQSYNKLWKQAQVFERKDLPKSEIGVMQKIITKATAAHDYGQLLAAEMRRAMLWEAISPDSLAPAIRRMEKQAGKATDPMLKAVWYAALGKLDAERRAECFRKALAQPELLARHTSGEYQPLTLKGMDGVSFGNDLLHLIGFEADTREAYQLMHDYYAKVGRSGAACLCALQVVQKDRWEDVREVRKSKYLNTIDSLIYEYQDLPEAGELAVEHFRFLEGAADAKPADKINYINYALSRWGGWSRMNVLRNAQKRLTEPMFQVSGMPKVLRPSQKQWVHLNVRNIQDLKITVSRINITADNDYDVNDGETYKLLMKKTSALHQKDYGRQFYGHPDYEEVEDSVLLAGLPLGAYLMEVTSGNTDIAPQRQLFYVSDLALMVQQLPDDWYRYVAVNATSGQPIAGAKMELYTIDYGKKTKMHKRVVQARFTTDANGEASFRKVEGDILVSTDEDKYSPAQNIYLGRIGYYEQKDNRTVANLFTDRSFYRPGQTVHATAILATSLKGLDAKALGPDKEVKFCLRDANRKVVAEKEAKTDAYGTASVDFELPQGGLTGQYSMQVNPGSGSRHFRVEEYRRPTFEVTFPKVNEKYTWGDTVVVKASAKTYAGLPVQGAKVEYTVTRRNQLWWWGNRSVDEQVLKAEGITREDGTFDVEIPLEATREYRPSDDTGNMNDFMRKARFFCFEVSAIVTDVSGESHAGEMSLPLGTKPTAFSANLPKRIELDSLRQVSFSYRNSAGMEIAGSLKFRVDGGKWMNAEANAPVAIHVEKSGVHELEAICGQDTLLQKFTVFCMTDTHPVEPTAHWCYQTANVFPRDGKPVYVQVGSSENGAHIVYSMVAGNKLIEKGAWELGDSIVTLPFTYKEEYASGIVINYCFVKDGVCYANTMSIARPLPEKKLNLAWKTFRSRLTPGQKEEWTLLITTADGKPAKAQLMSVLYDKSLDQIGKHLWNMELQFYQRLPNCYWKNSLSLYNRNIWGLSGTYPTRYYDEKELDVDKFDGSYFRTASFPIKAYRLSVLSDRSVATVRLKKQSAVENVEGIAVGYGMARKQADPASDKVEKALDNVQLRENLNETAFFYPALVSDDNGCVALKFTLPESVTTWKFMGLAHDVEMRNGSLVDEAVAQKTVMVQPNMPRFLREGDNAILAVKVFNTSEKKTDGNIRMQIIDPETNRVVWQKVQKYSIEANGTAAVDFTLPEMKEGIYINKVVAAGKGYSDGEQHYLPVLGNRELVTNTLPFTLTEKGTKQFDLAHLFADKEGKQSKDAQDAKVTIEYTGNPSWLMIQALPMVSQPADDNAVSLMAAIYSNSIARHILQSSPSIRQVVELWKKDVSAAGSSHGTSGKASTSLMSSLEKNQELKNLLLNETPWVMDADRESEQKRMLVNYFDESQNAGRLAQQVAKLKALQNGDGSFSWWKGMQDSRYMTTSVAEMMVRLNRMVGVQKETAGMLTAALDYLRQKASEEVKELKKAEEKEKIKNPCPSEEAVGYLYILSLDGRKLAASAANDLDWLVKKLAAKTCDFTIYGKALTAVVLGKQGYRQKANEYLQSIGEYAVYKPEMGRYFDTRKAYYSWFDYKIPTQVAAIEAMQILASDKKGAEISEMQRWLLQSKRTQAWKTPVNTVNAVYVFMNGKDRMLERTTENATFKIDGKTLDQPKATAGLGYVKTTKLGTAKTLFVEKKNEGTSWGAAYAQFTQPSAEVTSAESGIKIARRVSGGLAGKVGAKVKVTIVVEADRDYDFVQIADKRAACLEPANQLSGYQWGQGCYISPKDNATNFYFDRLSKGKHIVEMEYYIDRKGDYLSGTCTVQCAYSPEFGGRAEAYQLRINN